MNSDADQPTYHLQVIDETAPGRDRSARAKLHYRVFAHNVPRVVGLCRLFGHRPVVDGVDFGVPSAGRRYSRWVVCDRCGIRANPQGQLDCDQWQVGQRYTGPMTGRQPSKIEWERALGEGDLRNVGTLPRPTDTPGPWPSSPRGTLSAEVLLLGGFGSVSAELSIGTPGSETVVDAHLHLGRLGAIYLGFAQFGQGLQRRLNPTGHDSRVISVRVHGGSLWWQLWSRDNHWSHNDPKWMRGSVSIDPREWLRGPRRYFHEDIGEPVETVIRCAHGDDHRVRLQLQRWCEGRTKRKARWGHHWSADVRTVDGAISTRSDNGWKDGLIGWHVDLTRHGIEDGAWVQEAADQAAARVSVERARNIYQHTTGSPA